MRGLNKVMLIGNLGKDPVYQVMEGDVSMVRFPLATSEVFKDRSGRSLSQTEWHNIVTWRGLAELAAKNLRKGSLIYLEGRIQYRQLEDKNGKRYYMTEIIAENIVMLDKKSNSENYASVKAESTIQAVKNSNQTEESSLEPKIAGSTITEGIPNIDPLHLKDSDELL